MKQQSHQRPPTPKINKQNKPKRHPISMGVQECKWTNKIHVCENEPFQKLFKKKRTPKTVVHWSTHSQMNSQYATAETEQCHRSQCYFIPARQGSENWAMQCHHSETRSGWKVYEKIFTYKRSFFSPFFQLLAALLLKGQVVCVHMCVRSVYTLGKTWALLGCKHSSRTNLSQMHRQMSCSGLGDDMTL